MNFLIFGEFLRWTTRLYGRFACGIRYPFSQNVDKIFRIFNVNLTLSQSQTLLINFLFNATITNNQTTLFATASAIQL